MEVLLTVFSRDISVWDITAISVGVIVFIATFVSHRWQFFMQWLNGVRGSDWAAISAVIDVVSVVVQTEQARYGERVIGYQATLTYFYRNPDLQMGEYVRMFSREDEARSWTDTYKGCNVLVHVDPRNPANSTLLEADLDAVPVSTAQSC
jgi:hypothetical protein